MAEQIPEPARSTASTEDGRPFNDTPTRRRRRVFRAPTSTLWASMVLIAGSTVLPWLISPSLRATTLDIPLEFMWDLDAELDLYTLGLATTSIAGAVLLGSLIYQLDWLRRIAGGAAVAVGVAVVTQWARFLADIDLEGSFFGFIGVGVYACVAGGLLAMLARYRT